jgi:hypothetical protein
LAEGVSALDEGMCEAEQSVAEFASEHVGHFFYSGCPLLSVGGTSCSAKSCMRSPWFSSI